VRAGSEATKMRFQNRVGIAFPVATLSIANSNLPISSAEHPYFWYRVARWLTRMDTSGSVYRFSA